MNTNKMAPDQIKVHTLGLRADKALRDRIIKVAELSRRKPANVMLMCIEDHLPRMEAELGIIKAAAAKVKGRVI